MAAICQYRVNEQCTLANALLRTIELPGEILCRDDAFGACSDCKCPHTYNYVVASLTFSHLCSVGLKDSSLREGLLASIDSGPQCVEGGPGTELTKLLIFLRIVPEDAPGDDKNCGCKWSAHQMNIMGSARCRADVKKVVGWLEKSAKDRGWSWVFNEAAATGLVLAACDLADGMSWEFVVAKLPLVIAKSLVTDN